MVTILDNLMEIDQLGEINLSIKSEETSRSNPTLDAEINDHICEILFDTGSAMNFVSTESVKK